MTEVQKILKLNSRVDALKEKMIRLQTRRESLIQNRDTLVQEIKDAGYNPLKLKEEKETLTEELRSKTEKLESALSTAESILNSIPE